MSSYFVWSNNVEFNRLFSVLIQRKFRLDQLGRTLQDHINEENGCLMALCVDRDALKTQLNQFKKYTSKKQCAIGGTRLLALRHQLALCEEQINVLETRVLPQLHQIRANIMTRKNKIREAMEVLIELEFGMPAHLTRSDDDDEVQNS